LNDKLVGASRNQKVNTAADSCTAMKKWLATNPNGKLPTNKKIEG
jgi:hypothetical protein